MPARIVNLLVGPDADGMRLDAFLATGEDMPSRSACAKLVEEGAVTINGTLATSKSEKVLLGEVRMHPMGRPSSEDLKRASGITRRTRLGSLPVPPLRFPRAHST